jgi:hypothetical protein
MRREKKLSVNNEFGYWNNGLNVAGGGGWVGMEEEREWW